MDALNLCQDRTLQRKLLIRRQQELQVHVHSQAACLETIDGQRTVCLDCECPCGPDTQTSVLRGSPGQDSGLRETWVQISASPLVAQRSRVSQLTASSLDVHIHR